MPVGDLPGWRQIFAEDFTTNASLGLASQSGSFLNRYGNRFGVYGDGWPDTAGKLGRPSRYYPSRVLSVSNGLLNKYLHTENGTPMGAAILPKVNGQVHAQAYGKYAVRFRADSLHGFRAAWMLWPQSGVFPRDGEIDYPEGGLDSSFCGFMHHQGATVGNDQYAVCHVGTYSSWHTASTEWTPNRVSFYLDGVQVGSSTSRIPNTPMHWVLQTESCLSACPAPTTAGNLQIDWLVMYAHN
jgi:hypothetical protein